MQQTHAVCGELAHYGSEPFNCVSYAQVCSSMLKYAQAWFTKAHDCAPTRN